MLQKSLRQHFTPLAAANTALGLLQVGRMEEALSTVVSAICKLAEQACGHPKAVDAAAQERCDCQHWGPHATLAAALLEHKATVLWTQHRGVEAVSSLGQSAQIIDRVSPFLCVRVLVRVPWPFSNWGGCCRLLRVWMIAMPRCSFPHATSLSTRPTRSVHVLRYRHAHAQLHGTWLAQRWRSTHGLRAGWTRISEAYGRRARHCRS